MPNLAVDDYWKERKARNPGRNDGRRQSPNYFLAIQITEEEIIQKVKEIQDIILDKERNLSHAMIDIPTLHLTLGVYYLGDRASVLQAAESLNRFHDKLKVSDFAPPSFTVSTLGNFNHKVVFASFADDQGLKDLNTLARDVKKSLEDDGLFTTDDKFNPHITICKMSRDMPRLRRLGIKRIEPSHYEEKKYTYFGKQTAGGIQLCSMVEPRSESGYYHIEHEIKF
ncbi:A-kinase anchor protein 7-like isoform X3 [Ostrea edulis]|uniref:A-kinase anchor protein 7-like isoform X3 n=1 Tax=Ostrea edulis TaxID=37623 RepID=UPI0024AEA6A6|nr:A-kinase anchor protein 7-like isoform X3 [Ostrea edulis]